MNVEEEEEEDDDVEEDDAEEEDRSQDQEAHTLCEPAQSKCTWTCHKRHFVLKFIGKMQDATATTSIEHRALTLTVPSLTVRTPSVWPHCLAKNVVNFQFWLVQPHQFPFNHSTTTQPPLNHH